jgi:hypothetical protein
MQTRLTALALALALAGIAGVASAGVTSVNTDVTASTVWGDDLPCGIPGCEDEIILELPIFVKNGAILTILPGTIVRGQPRTAAVLAGSTVGTPGALIVTQDGRIVADANVNFPIIMTTAAVDNNDDGIADDLDANGFKDPYPGFDPLSGCPGACAPDATPTFLDDTPTTAPLAPLNKAGLGNLSLWGGLVVLGHAPTNNADKCGVGWGKCTVEGLTIPGFPPADATYGGILPHDNSGVLRYVSIRHAGDEIGSGNELNGLSLGGVGSGTTVENIEVYVNFDDGVEWFGGTVNGRNLAVFFVGDDMFDVDEGYTGVNQFLFGIMPFFNNNNGTAYGSGSGDKAAEFDGDNYRPDNVALNDNVTTRIDVTNSFVDPTPWPLSNPSFYNMTLIGSTPDAGQDFVPTSAASTNRGIQFRNGFAGDVFNSIVLNTGAETGIEVVTGIGSGAPGFDVDDNIADDLVSLVCSTLDDGAALATAELDVVANGNALSASLGGTAAGNNVVNGAFPNLVKEDATFDPTGDAAGKLVAALKPTPMNPRPNVGITGVAGCVPPQGPGLSGVTYRGAFNRTAPTLWTTGWTTLNRAGLLAN